MIYHNICIDRKTGDIELQTRLVLSDERYIFTPANPLLPLEYYDELTALPEFNDLAAAIIADYPKPSEGFDEKIEQLQKLMDKTQRLFLEKEETL